MQRVRVCNASDGMPRCQKRNRRPGQEPLTTRPHHGCCASPQPPRPSRQPARPTTPRRLAGIEREARPRDNATVFYPLAKAASVFQKNQPPFSM